MAKNKFDEIEQARGLPMRDILIGMFKLYGLDEQPQQRVASELGVSQPTISQWIAKCNLRRIVKLVESTSGRGDVARKDEQEQPLPGFEHLLQESA